MSGGFYRLEVKTLSKAAGQSASAAHSYDVRARHSDKSDVRSAGSVNMPAWATSPDMYWLACDTGERANAMLARRAIVSFPVALPDEARDQSIRNWLSESCPNMPASWAIHDSGDGNPHAHLLVSERINDGLARTPETWFKRANTTEPAKGGAKKAGIGSNRKEWLLQARASWAGVLNRRLPANRQVDHRSLRDRGIQGRDPQPKLGAAVLAVESKGIRTRLMSSVIEDASQKCQIRCLTFTDAASGREVTFRAAADLGDRINVLGKPSRVKCVEMVKMCKERGWASVEVTGTDEFQTLIRAELRRAGIKIQGEDHGQNGEHHRGQDGRGIGEGGDKGRGERDGGASPDRGRHEPDRRSSRGPGRGDGEAGSDACRSETSAEGAPAGSDAPAAGAASAGRCGAAGAGSGGMRGDIHYLAESDGVPASQKTGGVDMQKDLTSIQVRKQLDSMRGCESFEIGIRDGRSGKMQNFETDRAGVLASVTRLKRENAKGDDIYIRPSPKESHPYVLLDDVGIGTIRQMEQDGLAPAAEVETSPMNYQVLLRLPESLHRADRKAVERLLVERYGADLGSADGGHYMRLSGFTNRKPAHVQDSGRFPFVKLSARRPQSAVMPAATWLPIKQAAEQRLADELDASPKPSAKPLPLASPKALAGGVIVGMPQVLASAKRQYAAARSKWGPHQFDASRADYFIARNLLQRGVDRD